MFEKVREILERMMEDRTAEIMPQSRLTADLGLSSLDLVNAVVTVEDELGVEVPDRDIAEFVTVGDVVEWLEKALG